jgi:hypothetical protein
MATLHNKTASALPSHQPVAEAVAPLMSLLEMGRGQFTLAFVYYERPGQRRWITTKLQHALTDWTLAEVSLQDPALDLRNLSGRFFDNLQEIARRNAPEHTYDAVLLLDWEQRLVPDLPLTQQPSTSLVGVFNMGRHLLERAFPCPCVVFVPQEAMTTLLKLAPDFVSWQSGAFFVPFEAAEVEADIRTMLETARGAQHDEATAAVARLETYLSDLRGLDEYGLPADLVAEALAYLGNHSLR